MPIEQRDCWICVVCGFAWLAENSAKPPVQCASNRCRSRKWNRQADTTPVVESKTVMASPIPDPVRQLLKDIEQRLPPIVPEQEQVKMCSHREWDSELGEWYGCSLPEHSRKTKCQRGQQVDGPSSR